MHPNKNPAAGGNRRTGFEAVSFATEPSNPTKFSQSRQQRRPPALSGLSRAICDALADIPREDHAEIMRWLTGRGLIGLAHERGFKAAAATAYRYADTLAGGVR